MSKHPTRRNTFLVMSTLILAGVLPASSGVESPTATASSTRVEPSDDPAGEETPWTRTAMTPWRYIGILSNPDDANCPPAPGWTAQRLFDPRGEHGQRRQGDNSQQLDPRDERRQRRQGDDDQRPGPRGDRGQRRQGDGAAIPRGLRAFCLYQSSDGDRARLLDLKTQGKLRRVAPDHMAVGAAGEELKRAIWEALRDHFLEQVGATDLPVGEGLRRPRLAVLDTGPTNPVDPEDGWTDSSPHGYTLVNMAKELLCDSDACLAEVTSRLTLAHKDLSPRRDPEKGGYIGTLGELAAAIRREVSEWQRARPGNKPPLILNLSLGWDGGLFGGVEADVPKMPPDVQAVYRALQDAACRGVLVIAAAGNTSGGPEREKGPLHPAAWEQRSAPDLATCQAALAPGAPVKDLWSSSSPPYWPLVYAAGGVETDGDVLANSRPEGEPVRTAFADHAVVDDSRDAPTAIITGSSAAAAVTAAAAAAAWHYLPGAKPYEVMDVVSRAGHPLGRQADFCLGGPPCSKVRRVSVCRAVHEACTTGAGACPPLPPCSPRERLDLAGVDLSTFSGSAETLDLSLATSSQNFPQCGAETLHYQTAPPTDPCPHRQYDGLSADFWNHPQPESDPCSSCWMEATSGLTSATLYVEIDPDFEGELSNATLVIGSQAHSLALSVPVNGSAEVQNVSVPPSISTPVFLSFTVDGVSSTSSPVLVVEN